ncbi:MAG: cupredoxin domain-containing protein [Actinomycetota bacterium]
MRISRTFVCSALVVVLLLLSAGFASTAFADARDLNIQVDLAHGFSPQQASLSTGTTVVWTNIEKFDYPELRGAHTVVADDGSFASPEIAPGSSWTYTFLAPGTYAYHCSIHPNLLHGTLTVSGPKITPPKNQTTVAIVEPGGNVQNAGYDPKDLTGNSGLTVTWRNQGAQAHTVTVDGVFDSGDIQPGQTWSHTFSAPISVSYYCSIHPWMKGTVRIADAGGKPPPLAPTLRKSGSSGSSAPPQQPQRGSGPITLLVNIVEPDESNPQSWGFAPSELQARVGDTVVWTNTGIAPHTVTASNQAFSSGSVAPGATFVFHPSQTGTIGYFCSYHPWMKGSLQILAKGTSNSVVLGEKLQRTPAPRSSSGALGVPGSVPSKPSADAHRRSNLLWILLGAIAFLEVLIVAPAMFYRALPPFFRQMKDAPMIESIEEPIEQPKEHAHV